MVTQPFPSPSSDLSPREWARVRETASCSLYADSAAEAEAKCARFYGGAWQSTSLYGLEIQFADGSVGYYWDVKRLN
jgi:hypothetical protein